jgi:hypothetical protein
MLEKGAEARLILARKKLGMSYKDKRKRGASMIDRGGRTLQRMNQLPARALVKISLPSVTSSGESEQTGKSIRTSSLAIKIPAAFPGSHAMLSA